MYILEGNIGAGKSTFLTLVTKYLPQVTVGYEPLADWQGEEFGQSILHSFYSDPARWGYTMETFSMLSRARDHLRDQQRTELYRIIERSIYSGHYCFALNSYRSGFLSELEWNLYTQWFNFLIPGHCEVPRGFIYLQVAPEVAYERLKKRARSEESTVPLEYLKQLDSCHDDFLIYKKNILAELHNVPVLVLSCDDDFEHNENKLMNILSQLHDFLVTTTPKAMIQSIHEKPTYAD